VTNSFKDTLEAIAHPTIFPNELHPENTPTVSRAPWGRYFINTIFVSVSVTSRAHHGLPRAYAFAR